MRAGKHEETDCQMAHQLAQELDLPYDEVCDTIFCLILNRACCLKLTEVHMNGCNARPFSLTLNCSF